MFEDTAKPHTREQIRASIGDELIPRNGGSVTFFSFSAASMAYGSSWARD